LRPGPQHAAAALTAAQAAALRAQLDAQRMHASIAQERMQHKLAHERQRVERAVALNEDMLAQRWGGAVGGGWDGGRAPEPGGGTLAAAGLALHRAGLGSGRRVEARLAAR
jgi:hypothetical protein